VAATIALQATHTGGVGHQRCPAQTLAAIALSRSGQKTSSVMESDPHAEAVIRWCDGGEFGVDERGQK